MSATPCGEPDQYEFGGPDFFADPYPVYARIRATGEPVFETSSRSWLITRYADVEALLREARISKNIRRATPTPFDLSVLFQDPPDHTRIRSALNEAFSGSAMDGLETRVRTIADRLIDRMQERRRTDFVAGFALPLPLAVFAELLGVPPEDTDNLRRWSSEFMVEETVSQAESARRQHAAVSAMAEYFGALISRRWKDPQDDVIGALIRAQLDGMRLSRDELVGNCILLMIAGHETTVNLLGNGLALLLQHRERFEQVKRQPELLPSTIEETLRYESPVQLSTFRVTTAPLEFRGRTLDAGSMVTAVLGAANRDPEQFSEPDRFDLTRSPNRHLAFGMGPHRCLGASLTRIEARIGFSRLLERLPNLRLDSMPPAPAWSAGTGLRSIVGRLPWWRAASHPQRWRRNAVMRGLSELIVSC